MLNLTTARCFLLSAASTLTSHKFNSIPKVLVIFSWRLVWIVLSWIIICLNSCTIKLYLKFHTASWVLLLDSICIILFFLVPRNVNWYPKTFLKYTASEWLPQFILLFHGHEHPRYYDRCERQELFLKMHNSFHTPRITLDNCNSWLCFRWFKSGKIICYLWN